MLINNKLDKKKIKKCEVKDKKFIKKYLLINSPYIKNKFIVKKFLRPKFLNKDNKKEIDKEIKKLVVSKSKKELKIDVKLPSIYKSRSSSKNKNIANSNIKIIKIKYFIGKGNNCKAIKNILEKRENWEESKHALDVNIRWQQLSINFDFQRLKNQNLSFNHFKYHETLSDKNNLIWNLKKKYSKSVWDFFPYTLIFDMRNKFFEEQMNEFKKLFNNTGNNLDNHEFNFNFINKKKINPKTFKKPSFNDFNHKIEKSNSNMWVLKANNFNRGNGILVFNKLSNLEEFLKKFYLGFSNNDFIEKKDLNFIFKSQTFMIQKYIENPYLYDERKFDIRVWVLLNNDKNIYIYKEYYFRTSSNKFNLNCDNLYIHLTNNAVQKYGENYGQFEEGNILSKTIFFENTKVNEEKLIKNIENIICKTFTSVKNKIFGKNYNNCYEIFGFDFMLDKEENLFLIEVNTNPCIEESNKYLKTVIPKMLKDTFEITIDKQFNYNSYNENNNWKYIHTIN